MRLFFLFLFFVAALSSSAQDRQWVEGYDSVLFHYNANRSGAVRDFRGTVSGYMTGAWWSDSQRNNSILKWRTAAVPEKKATSFAFIGSSSTLPSEITKGPLIKLSVNGKYALTFSIGMTRDFLWKEGDYELKYISKRVEYPYAYQWRQIHLNGISGIYQLSVPASDIEPGKPVDIQVELLPFERWANGWFMVKARKDVLKESIATLSGEVEALRQDMALANLQTQILATQVYSKMLGGDKFEHHVAYTNGYRHLHPADIIKLRNGDILMMTREATEHFARDGEVVMIRSKDGGKTWGQRQVISKIRDLDEREGCGIQLKDGTIIVGVFYNNLYNPDGTYDWDRRIQRTNDPEIRSLGAHIITSKDNGYTWSEAHFIDTRGMPFTNIEGPTDAPIEMPDGSILMGI
ncbi:MAG TPA: sialidase family protein, partial [Flavitalea sp.]|nr:sialidase family protein [Flavitalea sp.]